MVLGNKDNEGLTSTFAPVEDFSIVILLLSIVHRRSRKYIRSITVVHFSRF